MEEKGSSCCPEVAGFGHLRLIHHCHPRAGGAGPPTLGQSCLSGCFISCFMSNLVPREPLSEGTYFPWDRSQAEPKVILQQGVSGKSFGVPPSPWQDLSSAGLNELIVGTRRVMARLGEGGQPGVCGHGWSWGQ